MKFLRRIPIVLIIAALLSAGAVFAYMYVHRVIVNKNAEIGAGVRQLSQTNTGGGQFLTLKKSLADNAKMLDKVSAYVVGVDGVVAFIQKIETLGRTFDIELEISSLTEGSLKGEEVLPESLELLKVQLTASGNWDDLLQFFVSIESMRNAVRVDSVQLQRVGEEFTKAGSWSGFFSFITLKKK